MATLGYNPPVILVQEWDDGDLIAVSYHCGNNVLDFSLVWRRIGSLKSHPGRGSISYEADHAGNHGIFFLSHPLLPSAKKLTDT